MKYVFSKLSTKVLVVLLLVLPALTSCDQCKEEDKPSAREQLVGKWIIKSFTIDGVEVIGSIVTSSKLELEAYSGSKGDFEWSILFSDRTSETQSGDYKIDEAEKEIDFEDKEGEHQVFDYGLEGDDLELTGILDGERVVLKADRD